MLAIKASINLFILFPFLMYIQLTLHQRHGASSSL
ncbi:hypothetical protein DNTS_025579 [Danionella cerebrum]|uniref:Uncharacterized protein n=1 Tax=Danionella cerebrum TaxID=2873325 RepID=A0A553PYQ3_9TELE|nr:hypothetical protein DNTS_025579 [Danionella translucida]